MGPTGSGKSAMALAIAARRPTVIINADAMQMVSSLRVLSARPTVEEEAQAEHALYGVLQPQEPTSVAVWLERVVPVITRAFAEHKLPLLVGGTGMYVKALQEGLAEVPPIPEAIRQKYRAMAQQELHPALAALDGEMASRLKPGDTQRLIRALEVKEATGRSLTYWQEQPAVRAFPEATFRYYYMAMPREEVYARIDRRFLAMMEQNALAEVKALLALGLPADVPILRAHGVPELAAYLAGKIALNEAVSKGQQNTRNYAKRQMTWIRNQLPEAIAISDSTNIPLI